MKDLSTDQWEAIPGADLLQRGLADLQACRITEHSLLVLVGEPRLKALDVTFPDWRPMFNGPVEHALYDLLALHYGNDAHSRYNSLVRRMNSFAHALEREQTLSKRTNRPPNL